jgi:hypothetical protein
MSIESVLMVICSTNCLLDEDIIRVQMVNKTMYVNLFHRVRHIYERYINSDKFKNNVVVYLNKTSNIIDQFKWNNKLLTNMMFDFIIACYENWSWLSMDDSYKQRLELPKSKHFTSFLKEHGIAMHDVLPPIEFHYTHQHRPTKTYTYYKTIYMFKKCSGYSQ